MMRMAWLREYAARAIRTWQYAEGKLPTYGLPALEPATYHRTLFDVADLQG